MDRRSRAILTLILLLPFWVVLIVGLARGAAQDLGVLLVYLLCVIFFTSLLVRSVQVRAVITPQELVSHELLWVRRADIITIEALDMTQRSGGDWCAQVRLRDGRKFKVDALDPGQGKSGPSDEGLQLLEEVRRVLRVGGETQIPGR
jgi:hypothetical protein